MGAPVQPSPSVATRDASIGLTFDALSVSYGQVDTSSEAGDGALALAVRDLSLVCQPGTATLLTGASGSGKSTVLRVLNGLATHVDGARFSGTAHVGDYDAISGELGALGAVIGAVFQHPRRQFFTATVVEELAFALSNRGMAPADIIDGVAHAAERVGVVDLLPRRLTELSGGQLQRVACAVALVGDPQVLLLDEPTSNFATDDIVNLQGLLTEVKHAGSTVMIAEHRVYYLRNVVDQVAVLRDGTLADVLPAEAFFNQPDEVRRAAGLRCLTPPSVAVDTPGGAADTPETSGPADSAATDALEHCRHVALSDIRFRFGEREVLNIPSLSVAGGEITAIMGPCGVGKSTLARVICGLETPERGGTVSFGGSPCNATTRVARSAMVMQDVHRQLFAATTRDELTTGSRLAAHHDPDATLRALDLAPFAERHPMSLSGGQKQRVVIGAATAADADVYVFDEPTSGVDYAHLCSIAAVMREIADRGAVVLVITHDLELVDECADRVLTLGTPTEPGGLTHITDTRHTPNA